MRHHHHYRTPVCTGVIFSAKCRLLSANSRSNPARRRAIGSFPDFTPNHPGCSGSKDRSMPSPRQTLRRACQTAAPTRATSKKPRNRLTSSPTHSRRPSYPGGGPPTPARSRMVNDVRAPSDAKDRLRADPWLRRLGCPEEARCRRGYASVSLIRCGCAKEEP